MSKELDKRLKGMLVSELDTVKMTDEADRRVLAGIHKQIKERSNIMRYPKKKLIVAIAAAVAVTGTITAVAAGKIVGLVSSTGPDQAVHSTTELENQAEKRLNAKIYIADTLADGSAFKEGYITDVGGLDEEGNTVVTYPEVYAMYGADGQVSLSIAKLAAGIPEDETINLREETYNGIVLGGREDQYLFLPPDTKPSEEDLKLEAEGKLYISYGSSEIERKMFRTVNWEKDGIKYLLFTFGDQSLDELFGMAKGYLDEAK